MDCGADKMTDQELIDAYAHGTTDLYRVKIVMQSTNFIVFRTPGHTDWAGVGSRAYYASHTVLTKKGEWCLNGDRTEWYGKVKKATLKAALDKAEKAGKVVRKEFGDLYAGAQDAPGGSW
jgi:hypothetical protein